MVEEENRFLQVILCVHTHNKCNKIQTLTEFKNRSSRSTEYVLKQPGLHRKTPSWKKEQQITKIKKQSRQKHL